MNPLQIQIFYFFINHLFLIDWNKNCHIIIFYLKFFYFILKLLKLNQIFRYYFSFELIYRRLPLSLKYYTPYILHYFLFDQEKAIKNWVLPILLISNSVVMAVDYKSIGILQLMNIGKFSIGRRNMVVLTPSSSKIKKLNIIIINTNIILIHIQ